MAKTKDQKKIEELEETIRGMGAEVKRLVKSIEDKMEFIRVVKGLAGGPRSSAERMISDPEAIEVLSQWKAENNILRQDNERSGALLTEIMRHALQMNNSTVTTMVRGGSDERFQDCKSFGQ